MEWEYHTIVVSCADGNTFDFADWKIISDEQGSQGWELVNFQLDSGNNYILAVFKRPI
jgi:hypothetical protein